MRKPFSSALFLSSLTLLLQVSVHSVAVDPMTLADLPQTNETPPAVEPDQAPQPVVPPPPAAPFQAFTGKVTKHKVRLRQQPNLDGPILRELKHGDLLIVVGETDDFYAVQPPADIKAFVFRTYILDNVVEANRVNVRMAPDVDAPVIAQLTTGDRVNGTVSATNNKWLEIAPPESARFYVAKDYIEKLGDPSVMATIEKRREEVNMLLNSSYLVSQTEMQKPFPDINLNTVYTNFNKIISDYTDFPEQVSRARELQATLQDNYLQKKIAFLESKTKTAQNDWQNKNSELSAQVKNQQQKLSQMEQQLQKKTSSASSSGNGISTKMSAWLPIEQSFYQNWAQQNNQRSQEEFYLEQQEKAVVLTGIIEPYSRIIKNKPGDYMIVNQSNNLPIAFLYSTQSNLQNFVGQNVTIHAVSRPNNNFAFPAYFVLWVE